VFDSEICIPYLDPALSETRSKIFQISYGFKCACRSCTFLNTLIPLSPVPTGGSDRMRLAGELRQFAGIHPGITSLPTTQLEKLPAGLGCVLMEDYISSLSEEFSKASHEGVYTVAFDVGLTLLAIYVVIYPANYPQIGKLICCSVFLLMGTMFRNASARIDQIFMERTILGGHDRR